MKPSGVIVLFAIGCGTPGQAPPPDPQPTTFASLTGDRGAIDKAIIRRHLRLYRRDVRACYETALAAKPGLAGRVDARFVIARDGRVAEVQVTGLPAAPEVAPCIAHVIELIRFPAPQGGVVTVTDYPFMFATTSQGAGT